MNSAVPGQTTWDFQLTTHTTRTQLLHFRPCLIQDTCSTIVHPIGVQEEDGNVTIDLILTRSGNKNTTWLSFPSQYRDTVTW